MSARLQDHARPDAAQVASKALLRAASLLGVSARELAPVVGLSEASVSRLKAGSGSTLTGKPYELALLFIRLFRSLDALTGGDAASARAWMRAPNAVLGAAPVERIARIDGLVETLAYLDARRAPL